jgi:hypothetical protein
VFDRTDRGFRSVLGLKKPLPHSGDNEAINGQEDVKWKAKRQGESDKADQCPEKNALAFDESGILKKVREQNGEEKDGQGRGNFFCQMQDAFSRDSKDHA